MVGYGAMSFSNFYGPATDEGSMRILNACLDLGITHIDTANVYGMGLSEEIIGRFIKDNPGKFAIHTKGGLYRNPETKERWFRNDADYLREELEKSLR